MATQVNQFSLPYKNVAVAIILCVVLGPVGLLYASFWGGVVMSLIGIIVVSNKFAFPIVLCWMICCMWAVRSVEKYNRALFQVSLEKSAATQ